MEALIVVAFGIQALITMMLLSTMHFYVKRINDRVIDIKCELDVPPRMGPDKMTTYSPPQAVPGTFHIYKVNPMVSSNVYTTAECPFDIRIVYIRKIDGDTWSGSFTTLDGTTEVIRMPFGEVTRGFYVENSKDTLKADQEYWPHRRIV